MIVNHAIAHPTIDHHAIAYPEIVHPAIAHPEIVHHAIAHPEIVHPVIVRHEIVYHVIAPHTIAHHVISRVIGRIFVYHVIVICNVIILATDHQYEEVYLKELIIIHLQFKVIQEELSKNRKVGTQVMILALILWTKIEHHLVVDIRVLNGILGEITLGVHNTVH